MEKKNKDSGGEPLNDWMNSAMNFWSGMAKMQSDFFEPYVNSDKKKEKAKRAQKTWENAGRTFQGFLNTLSRPETIEDMVKGLDSVPDLLTKFSQQAWDSYFELNKQWMERAGKAGQQSQAYSFDDIDQETFQAIRNLYENEFQKFLNIPSLGLTRFYQEKCSRMIDKYNIFQTSLSEFLYLFYVPFEKTSGVMQEKLGEMAEKGEVVEDFKEYYNIWIKILEGHYMTLLKSPEYTQVMDKTVEALLQYKSAKEDLMCDLLQSFPIPTNRDMDDLYKDFYHLKKKVQALSKQVDALSPPKKMTFPERRMQ